MKRIFITHEKNPAQITNCPLNFTVSKEGWDLGEPVGNGSTLDKAIQSFKQSWELKYDEAISVELLTK